jgi:hypothetical protein
MHTHDLLNETADHNAPSLQHVMEFHAILTTAFAPRLARKSKPGATRAQFPLAKLAA